MKHIEQLQEVFRLIDDLLKTPGIKIIAIDGNAAAGKTTLASQIVEKYQGNHFHMDDFFLPSEKKTALRLSEPGGNVDYERFLEEVLVKIGRDDDFSYRKYDCKVQAFSPPVPVRSERLNVVEGAYSMHPSLASYYDLKLFLSLDKAEQSRRILLRNGPVMHKRFIEEWIPLENRYFQELDVKAGCDFVFYV